MVGAFKLMLLTTYIQKNWKINRQNLRKTHLIKITENKQKFHRRSINSDGIKERGEFFSVLLLIFIFVYKIIRPKYALNFMCFLSYLSYFKNPSINAINFATKLRQCMSILVVNNTSILFDEPTLGLAFYDPICSHLWNPSH